ncbi:MAG TPA: right-handed parallel beta-helix repeat-containing protein [Rhizomicrobium sp.]
MDVLGQRVVIDGFSELGQGHNDLWCSPTSQGQFRVKDSEMSNSTGDAVYISQGCSDVRLIGDIVTGAGLGIAIPNVVNPQSSTARGIYFGAVEGTISGGVIEESEGIGLDLQGAARVSVDAMHIQGNGRGTAGGAGIVVDGSKTISVCGNHLEGNGGFEIASAQILFLNTSDNVNFCGNVYAAETIYNAALGPLYVYDAGTGAVVTNTHFFDIPGLQAANSIYSSGGALLLAPLQVPHVPLNAIGGLTLANDTTAAATQIDYASGEASDSTGTATIALSPSSPCSVNLANPNGANALDTGTVASNTTYFYFVIASSGGGNPSCMASASTAPSFKNAGSAYKTVVNGQTYAATPFPYIYNLASVAGLAPGQTVENNTPYITSPTTIISVGTLTSEAVATLSTSGCPLACVTTVALSTTSNMAPGMTVSDFFQSAGCTAIMQNSLANPPTGYKSYTVSYTSFTGTSFQLTPALTANSSSPPADCIVVSSGNTVQIAPAAASGTTTTGQNFKFETGLYRMVGPLYTTSNTIPTLVQFAQDGDTFYLTTPANDIKTGTVAKCAASFGTSLTTCPLSVPTGVQVQAFGRIVGGTSSQILLSSPDQTAIAAPTLFPGPPGFTTNSSATATSFPFRLTTNTFGLVQVQASANGTTVYEDTDGWVWHRGQ